MKNNDTTYYVYIHRRISDDKIFYVGKGKGDRLKSKKRNIFWHNIVKKHGFYPTKIFENLTEPEAHQIEIDTIKEFRYFGYKLANLTNGGEGTSGWRMSDEQRRLKSINNVFRRPDVIEKIKLSRTHRLFSAEARKKMSIASTGKKQSAETIEKRIEKLKGIPLKLEHRQKLSLANKGYKHTAEAKAKMTAANMGRVITDQCKQLISIANSKQCYCSNGMIFPSATLASKWVRENCGYKKASQSNISWCMAGKLKNAYGFKWSFNSFTEI